MKKYFRPKYLLLAGIAVIALLILTSYVQLQRDVPTVDVEAISQTDGAELQGGDEPSLVVTWPSKGSAAVAVGGVGLAAATNETRNQPIASLAKVMTAYVILKDHPLQTGEAGPVIQVQASDVDLYRAQEKNGESVIPVKEGWNFTQAELMQGLLIPSGNNFAHILANWNSGSVEAFAERMNQEAAALGMTNSHYAEPSGISPLTRSTAADQARLAEAAMANPVIAAVVNQKQADLPNVGVLYNVNSELGKSALIGVKTGWTEEAGGCFMFATNYPMEGGSVRIYGAVLGQDTLADAFNGSKTIAGGVGPQLQRIPVTTKDAELASISTDWGGRSIARAASDASVVIWPGLKVESTLEQTADMESVKQGQEVGKVVYTAGAQTVPVALIAADKLSGAGLGWRLSRLR